MQRAERISELVAEPDQENTNDAEEAQFELIEDFGAEVLEPLIAAAPRFSDFGRLCDIEIFEAIEDPRAAPVLIPWLKSENDVVREWSADALGRQGVTEAIPGMRSSIHPGSELLLDRTQAHASRARRWTRVTRNLLLAIVAPLAMVGVQLSP